MTTPGAESVAYRCPQCQAALQARLADAGRAVACPECGKAIKVPGLVPRRPTQPPAAAPPARAPRTVPPDGPPPATVPRPREPSAEPPAAAPSGSRATTDIVPPAGATAGPPPAQPQPSAHRRAPPAPTTFSVKCPVCDTLVYATPDEVGHTKTCPDCYSPVTITGPRSKPRRTNEVVESDFDGMLFKLSDPVTRPSYASNSSAHGSFVTEGEAALRRAEHEYEVKEAEERASTLSPFWGDLLQFVGDPAVIARWVVGAVLLTIIGKMLAATISWAGAPGGTWLFALLGFMALPVLVAPTVMFLGCTCLTIAEATSCGHPRVRQWPTNFFEWPVESLPFVVALLSSLAPGILVFAIALARGMPAGNAWLFLLASVYLFLPIVQASLLESDSLFELASPAVRESLREDFLAWATFYLITFALLWLVAVTVTMIHLDLSIGLWLVFAGVWTAVLLVYYRLLGRLAWACQTRAAAPEDDPA